MLYTITGKGEGESLNWELHADETEIEDSVTIEHVRRLYSDTIHQRPESREQGLKALRDALKGSRTNWITPDLKEWILDLGKFKSAFPALKRLDWLNGKVPLEPQFEWGETQASIQARAWSRQDERLNPDLYKGFSESALRSSYAWYESRVSFVLVPEAVRRTVIVFESPPEIQDSLRRFQIDFPHPERTGFIIMRFGSGKIRSELVDSIKAELKHHRLDGVRADEKQYNDKLFDNVQTFMHGCSFGIAVFEHAQEEGFNPNVAFEVGYLLAMGKKVCLLKDRRLKSLPTDLMGRLYIDFDSRDPARSAAKQLRSCCARTGLPEAASRRPIHGPPQCD